MEYRMRLDKMLCPVTPSKIDTKIKGKNKTITLANGSEVNILKEPGLTEISFDLLLPNVKYPSTIAIYDSGFKNAKYFLDELEKMKLEKRTFYFKLTRYMPDLKWLYDTNIKVSLEDYSIKEDVKQGFDVVVSVKLKQYKDYSTKVVKIEASGNTQIAEKRSTENAPNVKKYTVVEGDTLWNIAKRFYGDGSKYLVLFNENIGVIGNNPTALKVGMVLTIPDPTQDVPVAVKNAMGKTTGNSTSVAPYIGLVYEVKLTIKINNPKEIPGTITVVYIKGDLEKSDNIALTKSNINRTYLKHVDRDSLVIVAIKLHAGNTSFDVKTNAEAVERGHTPNGFIYLKTNANKDLLFEITPKHL